MKEVFSEPGIRKLFCKGQNINILGFMGHTISVTTAQCYYYSMKEATDNT